jgi:large subunit ribosomal protein L22
MVQDTQERTRRDPILAQIRTLEQADRKKVIKTKARRARILEDYVGHTIGVFNGYGYSNVHVTSDMVGRQLGSVAPRLKPAAQTRFMSISVRKMRMVSDLVVGLPVAQALDVLNFTPRVAAYHLAKTLKSAVANKLSVEGTAHLDAEHLVVSRIETGPAPTAKRIRYRSMGRVYRIRKRYCHLAVYLDIDERKVQETEARAETKGTKAKTPARKPTRKKAVVKKTAKRKTAKKTTKKATAKKSATKRTAAKKTKATSDSKTAKSEKKA